MPIIVDNITLDETNVEFNYAADFVKHTDKLVYLTGKAGTGKTTFLKYLKQTTEKNTVILAFTGVAAINAGGQTINSFFKIPFGPFIPDDKRLRTVANQNDTDRSTIYNHFQYNAEKLEIIRGLELLIIDEVSMVRCDLLDVIDRLLRVFRKKENEAFGGVQVILIGDTFQLPPIDKEWHLLESFYSSPFFFNSKVIENNKPIYIELKKIYRQNEQEFIDLLNRIRINQVTNAELGLLNSKYKPTFVPAENLNYITLATHNRIVDSTNLTKLEELKTDLKLFEATITDNFPESIMPTDKVLQLKEGAQIMFIKNDKSKRIYNGKIAKITSIDEQRIIAEYEDRGETVSILVEKQIWNNIRYSWNEEKKKIEEEIIGTFTQYPIKLAWAITVHKSQGLTFERVIADLGAAFASGQVYVALSRCTTFNGLILKSKIDKTAIKTAPEVLSFAQNETPSTLIVQELNSGKADFYYKKVREAIRQLDFNIAFENLIKALKFRNDIETDNFKRYFIVSALRIASYKTELEKSRVQLFDLHSSNIQLETSVAELSEKCSSKDEKISEQNKAIKLLLDKSEELEETEEKRVKEIAELSKTLILKEKKINEQEKIIQIQKNKIIDFEKIASKNKEEIIRLNNLKWYHKLIGRK